MAVVSIPSDLLDYIRRQSFGKKHFNMEFRSELVGSSQARLLAPPRWTCSLVGEQELLEEASAIWRAFLLSLDGNVNQVEIYDIRNPAPRGTMRGTLTLASGIAVGDTTISVTGGAGQAATTLLKGDWIGVGSGQTRQLFSVKADATANGSGVISLSVTPPARFAQTNGSGVAWDKPTCLMRRTSSETAWEAEGYFTSGFAVDLEESWE